MLTTTKLLSITTYVHIAVTIKILLDNAIVTIILMIETICMILHIIKIIGDWHSYIASSLLGTPCCYNTLHIAEAPLGSHIAEALMGPGLVHGTSIGDLK